MGIFNWIMELLRFDHSGTSIYKEPKDNNVPKGEIDKEVVPGPIKKKWREPEMREIPEEDAPNSVTDIFNQKIIDDMLDISRHISFHEATRSGTAKRKGIDNTPKLEHLKNMRNLAKNLFEPLRELCGNVPLHISSFYRCGALNRAVKGARGSDHMTGEAIDIDQDAMGQDARISNNELFHRIRKSNLKYYKLIAEYPNTNGKISWVHISFSKDPKKNNRKHIYIALKNKNGGAVYANYKGNEHRIK